MKDIQYIEKKIDEKYFDKVLNGTKTFELRKEDDCTFNEGDIIILNEIDGMKLFTGRSIARKVGFVLRDYPGVQKGYAIVSLLPTYIDNE